MHGILNRLWTFRRWRHDSGGKDDDLLRKELPFCAYLRAAAALICLNIPIQRKTAYFPFPALAPFFPGLSFSDLRTVNADKRYSGYRPFLTLPDTDGPVLSFKDNKKPSAIQLYQSKRLLI